VAFADQSFIDSWMALPQLVIIRDDVTVKDERSETSYRCEIGTFLPLVEAGEAWWKAEVATVGKGRKAQSSLTRISREAAGRFPLPFNRENIALIGNQLAGQPSGWAGLLGNAPRFFPAFRDLAAAHLGRPDCVRFAAVGSLGKTAMGKGGCDRAPGSSLSQPFL
jgi:hypothetical protein